MRARARRVARGRVPSVVRTGVSGVHVYMATWRSRAPLCLHNLMLMAMRSIPRRGYCLVPKNFTIFFQISHHIEFLDACVKY
jgi:hypothetical protein